jgi:hypothetical protein
MSLKYSFGEFEKGELIVIAFCPKCNEEFDYYFNNNGLSWNPMKENDEEEIIENGFIVAECECCYHNAYDDLFFGAKEDNGRYTPIDVYGVRGLL